MFCLFSFNDGSAKRSTWGYIVVFCTDIDDFYCKNTRLTEALHYILLLSLSTTKKANVLNALRLVLLL